MEAITPVSDPDVPHIEAITFQNVGPFRHAVLTFPPVKQRGGLFVFEGPNGAGKSTLLEGIAVLLGTAHNTGLFSLAHFADAFPPENREALIASWAGHPSSGQVVPGLPPIIETEARFHDPDANITFRTAGGATLALRKPSSQFTWFGQADEVSATLIQEMIGAAQQGPAKKEPLAWAAFAYRGHHPTASLETKGPQEITTPALRGSLAFSSVGLGSGVLGQQLINLESDRTRAKIYSQEKSDDAGRDALEKRSRSYQATLARFERAFTRVLGREVRIEFPLEQHAPRLLFDGKPIPVAQLGEGLRKTLSWLADLLVRLERVAWKDNTRSPFEQPFWLLLDEIDQSLHPKLAMRVIPALRELFPNALLFVSTHSPFVVASAGEGWLFRLRPTADHTISGPIDPIELEPGLSLGYVIEELFDAPSRFVDAKVLEAIAAHSKKVDELRRGHAIEWDDFLKQRRWLLRLNDEVRMMISLQEAAVADAIEERVASSMSVDDRGDPEESDRGS